MGGIQLHSSSHENCTKIVTNSSGRNKIQQLLTSANEQTQQWAALTFANLIKDERSKRTIAEHVPFDFFIELVKSGPVARRQASLCLAELAEYVFIQSLDGIRVIQDKSEIQISGNRIMTIVRELFSTEDSETRMWATKILFKLMERRENCHILLECGAMEVLFSASRFRYKETAEFAYGGIYKLSLETDLLAWAKSIGEKDMASISTPVTPKNRKQRSSPIVGINNRRNDLLTFRADTIVKSGKVYYEMTLNSAGWMQVGWASSNHSPKLGEALGSDNESFAIDGYRSCKWHNGSLNFGSGWAWSRGTILGFLLDLDHHNIAFSVNGRYIGIAFRASDCPNFNWAKGLFPAFTFSSKESASIDLGGNLKYLPTGYKSVWDAVSKKAGTMPKDFLQIWNMQTGEWEKVTLEHNVIMRSEIEIVDKKTERARAVCWILFCSTVHHKVSLKNPIELMRRNLKQGGFLHKNEICIIGASAIRVELVPGRGYIENLDTLSFYNDKLYNDLFFSYTRDRNTIKPFYVDNDRMWVKILLCNEEEVDWTLKFTPIFPEINTGREEQFSSDNVNALYNYARVEDIPTREFAASVVFHLSHSGCQVEARTFSTFVEVIITLLKTSSTDTVHLVLLALLKLKLEYTHELKPIIEEIVALTVSNDSKLRIGAMSLIESYFGHFPDNFSKDIIHIDFATVLSSIMGLGLELRRITVENEFRKRLRPQIKHIPGIQVAACAAAKKMLDLISLDPQFVMPEHELIRMFEMLGYDNLDIQTLVVVCLKKAFSNAEKLLKQQAYDTTFLVELLFKDDHNVHESAASLLCTLCEENVPQQKSVAIVLVEHLENVVQILQSQENDRIVDILGVLLLLSDSEPLLEAINLQRTDFLAVLIGLLNNFIGAIQSGVCHLLAQFTKHTALCHHILELQAVEKLISVFVDEGTGQIAEYWSMKALTHLASDVSVYIDYIKEINIDQIEQEGNYRLMRWISMMFALLSIPNDPSHKPGAFLIEESPHPYKSDDTFFKEVFVRNADALELKFDSECQTEENLDVLEIYLDDPNNNTAVLPLKRFSGYGPSDWSTITIPKERFWIKFTSTSSITYWGYGVAITPRFYHFGAEYDDNIGALLNMRGSIDFLLKLINSNDIETKKWAVMALSNIMFANEDVVGRSNLLSIQFRTMYKLMDLVLPGKFSYEVKNNTRILLTLRTNLRVFRGKVYYETTLTSSGLMQLGWLANESFPLSGSHGVGDDDKSFGVDGYRQKKCFSGSIDYGGEWSWGEGDTIGYAVDFGAKSMRFFRNGCDLGIAFTKEHMNGCVENGLVPGGSFSGFQGAFYNFGQAPLKFLPEGYVSVLEAVRDPNSGSDAWFVVEWERYDFKKRKWVTAESDRYFIHEEQTDEYLKEDLTRQAARGLCSIKICGESLDRVLDMFLHSKDNETQIWALKALCNAAKYEENKQKIMEGYGFKAIAIAASLDKIDFKYAVNSIASDVRTFLRIIESWSDRVVESRPSFEVWNSSIWKFPTLRVSHPVSSGKVYYENQLKSKGCMQLGWALPQCVPKFGGNGIGDDDLSYGVDGYREAKWFNGSHDYGPNGWNWSEGDVVGHLIDFDEGLMHFSLNGHDLGVAFTLEDHGTRLWSEGVYAAGSFSKDTGAFYNFGQDPSYPLNYMPKDYTSYFDACGCPSDLRLQVLDHGNPNLYIDIKQKFNLLIMQKDTDFERTDFINVARFCFKALFYLTLEPSNFSEQSLVFESKHNYDNCMNFVDTAYIPCASKLHIEFDNRCSLESSYDYIEFFSDSEMKVPLAKYTGIQGSAEYEKLEVANDHVTYKFVSSIADTYWGYRFIIKPEYPKSSNPAKKQQSLVNIGGFDILFDFFHSFDPGISRYAGLVLVNLVCNAELKQRIVGEYGALWINELLESNHSDVQVGAAQGIVGVSNLDETTIEFITRNKLLKSFIIMALSSREDAQKLVVRVLVALLGSLLPVSDMEPDLCELLLYYTAHIDREVKVSAFKVLSKYAETVDGRDRICNCGGLSIFMCAISNKDKEISRSAANALVQLLDDEEKILVFLDSGAIKGTVGMLNSGNALSVGCALKLFSSLAKKKVFNRTTLDKSKKLDLIPFLVNDHVIGIDGLHIPENKEEQEQEQTNHQASNTKRKHKGKDKKKKKGVEVEVEGGAEVEVEAKIEVEETDGKSKRRKKGKILSVLKSDAKVEKDKKQKHGEKEKKKQTAIQDEVKEDLVTEDALLGNNRRIEKRAEVHGKSMCGRKTRLIPDSFEEINGIEEINELIEEEEEQINGSYILLENSLEFDGGPQLYGYSIAEKSMKVFGYHFWIRLDQQPSDLSPIFYRGIPNYNLFPNSGLPSVRANVCIKQGKVYYETILLSGGAQQNGWATPDFVPHSYHGVGDDTTSIGLDGSRSCFWFGECRQYGPPNWKWKTGDVIGYLVDFDNETIQFFLNGTDFGVAITGNDLDFKNGLYPACTVSSCEGAYFNFGQENLKYKPEGSITVQECNNGVLPILECWDFDLKAWRLIKSSDNILDRKRFEPPSQTIIIGVNPSLNVFFSLGIEGDIRHTVESSAEIAIDTWCHVSVSVNDLDVEIIVNQQSTQNLLPNLPLSNDLPIYFGGTPGCVEKNECEINGWIDEVIFSLGSCEDTPRKMPLHLDIISRIFEALYPIISTIINAFINEEVEDHRNAALYLLTSLAFCEDVFSIFKSDASYSLDFFKLIKHHNALLEKLLKQLHDPDIGTAIRSLKAIALFSKDSSFRSNLISHNGMIKILSLDEKTKSLKQGPLMRYWAEIIFSRMYLSEEEVASHEDEIFFRNRISCKPNISISAYNSMPLGIFHMQSNIQTLLDIGKLVAEPFSQYINVDRVSVLPDEVDEELLKWLVQTIYLLTFNPKEQLDDEAVQNYESSHPYEQIDIVQEISFPGAISIYIEFDRQCATELNYDWLGFYTEDALQNRVGYYTGPGPWDPLEIPSDMIKFRFYCDSSNNG